jgi:hypothetical protein
MATKTVTRDDLAHEIAELRARQKRLPVHFEDKREVLAEEIDVLVRRLLALDG